MQKQPSDAFPYTYRPYDFQADFPVYAFLGDNWKIQPHLPKYLHFHNALEIGHCLDGNGILYHDNHSEHFFAGNFSIIFPQVPHITIASEQPSTWEYLFIDVKSLLKDKSKDTDTLWQTFYMLQRIPFILSEKDSSSIYYYLQQIFREFHEKGTYYLDAVSGLLIALLAELNRLTANTEFPDINESKDTFYYIRNALSYIYP